MGYGEVDPDTGGRRTKSHQTWKRVLFGVFGHAWRTSQIDAGSAPGVNRAEGIKVLDILPVLLWKSDGYCASESSQVLQDGRVFGADLHCTNEWICKIMFWCCCSNCVICSFVGAANLVLFTSEHNWPFLSLLLVGELTRFTAYARCAGERQLRLMEVAGL